MVVCSETSKLRTLIRTGSYHIPCESSRVTADGSTQHSVPGVFHRQKAILLRAKSFIE
jgi:hypothetical protein